jgi:hypothetical protein
MLKLRRFIKISALKTTSLIRSISLYFLPVRWMEFHSAITQLQEAPGSNRITTGNTRFHLKRVKMPQFQIILFQEKFLE